MKKGVLWGIGLALASVMLWGCSRDYIETAVTEAESTRAESTAEIVIVQETETAAEEENDTGFQGILAQLPYRSVGSCRSRKSKAGGSYDEQ